MPKYSSGWYIDTGASSTTAVAGDYIAIAGIGTAPYYATNYSTLANTGSGYSPGDLVAFDSGSSFKQQIVIAVDAVGLATTSTAASSGNVITVASATGVQIGNPVAGTGVPAGTYVTRIAGTALTLSQSASISGSGVSILITGVSGSGYIAQWHFLYGGQYPIAAASLPSNPLSQNSSASFLQTSGSGATLTVSWSGWSAVENGKHGTKITNPLGVGSSYNVGDILGVPGGTAWQQAKIVVDAVTGGAITEFHFVNYGSYSVLPSSGAVTMSTITGGGSGATFNFVWSWGTLATTVQSVSGGLIYLTDAPALPTAYSGTQNALAWHYGHDDGAAINAEIANASGASLISVPGKCGTTVQIELPNNLGAQNLNPTLAGLSQAESGVYALGINQPSSSSFIRPMTHVIHKSPSTSSNTDTNGGGIKDMTVEALGIPQGYMSAAGNVYAPTNPISSATGTAVELDAGNMMQVSNVWIKDAIGTGNANFRCGFGITAFASLTGFMPIKGSLGGIWVSNSRFETVDSAISGAQNPDYDLDSTSGCHDSYFLNLVAVNAGLANIKNDYGNHFIAPHTFNSLYPSVPGTAQYGFRLYGKTRITDMQCDDANNACVYIGITGNSNSRINRVNIIGMTMDCGGAFNDASWSLPSTYYGVELASGVPRVTITGVIPTEVCNIPGNQLIHLDGILDPTVQIFGNGAAIIAQLNLPTFSVPQGRLSLTSGIPVMNADVVGGTVVYYTPYLGQNVPWWNGAMFVAQGIGFSGISLNLDSTTGHTGAQLLGSAYDIFLCEPLGLPALCTGPAWPSLTSTPSSRNLALQNGIWVNSGSSGMVARYNSASGNYFTCPQYQCTYLGSLYATGNGATTMQFGPNLVAPGTPNVLALYNAYNKVSTSSELLDSSSPYQYCTPTWRPMNGSTGNSISFLDGLGDIVISTSVTDFVGSIGTANGGPGSIGVDINDTTSTPTGQARNNSTSKTTINSHRRHTPILGWNYVQAMENALTGTIGGTCNTAGSGTAWFGDNGLQSMTLDIDD